MAKWKRSCLQNSYCRGSIPLRASKGGVPEWLNGLVLKTSMAVTSSGVRIPPPPLNVKLINSFPPFLIMNKWRIVEDENIADLAIEIFGKNKKDLLKNILLAFTSLTVHIKKLKEVERLKKLQIEGETFEELIFNFIDRLIYFKDAESLLFKKGKFKISKRKIIADLVGQKISPDLPVKIDIKALTRHKFKLEKNKYYKITAVFDI